MEGKTLFWFKCDFSGVALWIKLKKMISCSEDNYEAFPQCDVTSDLSSNNLCGIPLPRRCSRILWLCRPNAA